MKSKDQQLLEEAYEGIFGKVQFTASMITAFATQDLQKLKELANNVQSNEALKSVAIKTAKGVMEKPGVNMDLKLMATKFLAFLMAPDESQEAYDQVSTADAHDSMHTYLRGGYAIERIKKAKENNEDILKVLTELEKKTGAVFGTLAKSLHSKKLISKQELDDYLGTKSARD